MASLENAIWLASSGNPILSFFNHGNHILSFEHLIILCT
uniref:Uncharacterized protein n=1 Tax=Rhizophora mucronata TaxID=61149 RepID=A0A2P2QB88_RHIMU